MLPSAHGVPFTTGVLWQPKTGSHVSVVQTLPSLQLSGVPAVHVPFWQRSLPLQTLASLQDVPFSTGAFTQPARASQVFVVQGLPSSQLRGVPGVQTPSWQVSPPLQTLPSVHDEPSAAGVFWQPTTGLQVSVVHTVPSSQLSGTPAVHTPAWQVSSPLQTFVSAHDAPFGTGVLRQPQAGSQVSVVHALPSLQMGGMPAVHEPAWQVSSPLQRLPSAHEEPLGKMGLLQTPAVQTSLVQGLPSAQSVAKTQDWQPGICVFWQPVTGAHESVVQALPSLQLSGVPAEHTPSWQVSLPLQTLPSRQGVPFRTAVLAHPKTGSQLSVVHTLLSLQLSAVPEVQVPPWQVSLPLQTLPSAHDTPLSTAVL
jgi:hypothetical protein